MTYTIIKVTLTMITATLVIAVIMMLMATKTCLVIKRDVCCRHTHTEYNEHGDYWFAVAA